MPVDIDKLVALLDRLLGSASGSPVSSPQAELGN
jgi:hypothetical protein